MNWALNKSIELECEGALPELAAYLKVIGRKKEIEDILEKIAKE